MPELTMYSTKISGERCNGHCAVAFDKTGRSGHTNGYIGITQFAKDGPTDRVLLSPKQIVMLIAFLKKPIRVQGME